MPLRSAKARRLTRIKPGFYTPPGGRPVFVPGMQWLSLIVMGMKGAPTLAAMRLVEYPRHRWRRIVAVSSGACLRRCWLTFGNQLLHVFLDRGFAGAPWLMELDRYPLRFVVRWPSHYTLLDALGHKRKAWEITRVSARSIIGSFGTAAAIVTAKPVYSSAGGPSGLFATSLVGALPPRPRAHPLVPPQPIEPIHSTDDAWHIVFAYARRWQIELTYRFSKCELCHGKPAPLAVG